MISESKLTCGRGGEGAVHSMVVEFQGFLSPVAFPARDMIKFTTNGICAAPRQNAEMVMNSFHWRMSEACAYV